MVVRYNWTGLGIRHDRSGWRWTVVIHLRDGGHDLAWTIGQECNMLEVSRGTLVFMRELSSHPLGLFYSGEVCLDIWL